MDAKLNHSDLSALLAKEAGMSLVKAELFTKNFFDLIIEGLEKDGIVKINGLGTFKITDVADRYTRFMGIFKREPKDDCSLRNGQRSG